jgi:hypothetical protein
MNVTDRRSSMQGSRQDERDIPIETLRELLRGLRYGTLELTVHDGRVVQIERRERVRLG